MRIRFCVGTKEQVTAALAKAESGTSTAAPPAAVAAISTNTSPGEYQGIEAELKIVREAQFSHPAAVAARREARERERLSARLDSINNQATQEILALNRD
jgi:hypothetical protein